jgi:hypothetical protein
MLRSLSSLLGLFFFTAGVVAVASLAKTSPALPVPSSEGAGSSDPPGGRYLALAAPDFHARFSLN